MISCHLLILLSSVLISTKASPIEARSSTNFATHTLTSTRNGQVTWQYSTCWGEPRTVPGNVPSHGMANGIAVLSTSTQSGISYANGATIETCLQFAADNGFSYAGLEYGGECWLGEHAPTGGPVPESYCNMPCNAASSELCGGGWVLSLYKVSSGTPANLDHASSYIKGTHTNWSFKSCWGEPLPHGNSNRALNGAFVTEGEGGPLAVGSFYKVQNIQQCLDAVATAGYRYAGLEYGGECWGSNTIFGGAVPDSYCNMACSDNPLERCGGSWTLSVYDSHA